MSPTVYPTGPHPKEANSLGPKYTFQTKSEQQHEENIKCQNADRILISPIKSSIV